MAEGFASLARRRGLLLLCATGLFGVTFLSQTLAALGEVKSFQKINSAEGGFGGSLPDGAQFGVSVALMGDLDGDGVNEMAVGARGPAAGSVWILFMNTDGTVKTQQQIAEGVGGFVEDATSLGSVTWLGDLDGDGVGDIAVGDEFDADGGPSRGAVWILFLRPDGTVNAVQKISDTAGGFTGGLADSDRFGRSVAGLGDLDGDGVEDLAVGAPRGAPVPADAAVWILLLDTDGTVKSQQEITPAQVGHGGTSFGHAMSFAGDFDGDGVGDLAVTDVSSAAWMLLLDTDGSLKSFVVLDPPTTDFGLGESIASIDDLDGDGVVDLVIGSTREDDAGLDGSGAIWVQLLELDGSVTQRQKISAAEGNFSNVIDEFDLFGAAASSLGDLDGDGVVDLVVGANGDDGGGNNRGAVYVLFLDGCGNGTVDGGEACDDGNTIDGDGCDSNCTVTGCGNGIVNAGEQCDDGNAVRNCDGCSNDCMVVAFCGDGTVDAACGEQCDDGNDVSNDGCERDCVPTAALSVLYDQTDAASGNGAPDQDFGSNYFGYASEGADDFVVTDPVGWDVRGLNIVGTHTGPGDVSFGRLFIYDDAGGRPAEAPISGCAYSFLADFVDNSGSIDWRFPICTLEPGTYWISEQVRQSFQTGGQHYWSNRAEQSGSPGVWRNPGNGFGIGCTDWTPQTECGVGGGDSPDWLFQLIGQSQTTGGDGGNTGGASTGGVPAVGPVGLLSLILALGGGLGYMIARSRRR